MKDPAVIKEERDRFPVKSEQDQTVPDNSVEGYCSVPCKSEPEQVLSHENGKSESTPDQSQIKPDKDVIGNGSGKLKIKPENLENKFHEEENFSERESSSGEESNSLTEVFVQSAPEGEYYPEDSYFGDDRSETILQRNRKIRYTYETNPSIRRRQHNRLLRKLKQTVDEYSSRIGGQAVILIATPGKPINFQCYGSKPLKDVVDNLSSVMDEHFELENVSLQ